MNRVAPNITNPMSSITTIDQRTMSLEYSRGGRIGSSARVSHQKKAVSSTAEATSTKTMPDDVHPSSSPPRLRAINRGPNPAMSSPAPSQSIGRGAALKRTLNSTAMAAIETRPTGMFT